GTRNPSSNRASTSRPLDSTENCLISALCCPLVDGLYLQEADSMLQLLCSPSQHRTDILSWICSRLVRSKDPEDLTKDMVSLGHEMMLCKANDLDLIRGHASPCKQLRFLEQLLSLVPGCTKSAGRRTDTEMLLNELYAAENLPLLAQMLEPSFDPWPAHTNHFHSVWMWAPRSYRPLSSPQCDFLSHGDQSPAVLSPSSLRVAACDLQQLMSTFSHVYESDLRSYCSRDPPTFSAETDVFKRVHRLLLALITVRTHTHSHTRGKYEYQPHTPDV
uniref:HAUS augmin-like complex, subunit 7 n=1 Tax=Labrus bergylta TaxID=56723 RepID=A0A3Q3F7A2_9LABR